MRVQAAVIREQGQTFAVVVVKQYVVQNRSQAARAIEGFTRVFGVPVVLMAQDGQRRLTYYGRPSISKFMSAVPMNRIPWREYSIN